MNQTKRLIFLDAFATIGILLVILFHLATVANPEIARKFGKFVPINAGNIGVLYFFFRSGYGLYYGKKYDWLTYFKRRFLKIVPALSITTIIAVTASVLVFKKVIFTSGKITAKTLIVNALGIQSLINEPIINGPTWFISVLLLFYLIFPIVRWLVNKGVISLIALALITLAFFEFNQYHYYFMIFSCGILAAKYQDKFSKPKPGHFNLLIILYLSYALFYAYFVIYHRFLFENDTHIAKLQMLNDFLISLCSYYILYFVEFDGVIEKMFIRISDYSYYLFLVHWPVIKFLNSLNTGLIYLPLFIIITLIFCVAVKNLDRLVQRALL